MTEGLVELRIEDVAHGGTCVARLDSRVVFVRHTLPGEVVAARVTERRSKWWRADAIEILEPSPDRVPHVWPLAGPGGVGGAELGHVARPAQWRWKAAVIEQALRRIGHIERAAGVREAPGDAQRGGLAWRTRIELAVDDDGRPGMHAARSSRVVPLAAMPLAVPAIAGHGVFGRRWPGVRRLAVAAPGVGEVVVLPYGRGAGALGAGGGFAGGGAAGVLAETVTARVPGDLAEALGGSFRADGEWVARFDFEVPAGAFWQVHRQAPAVLVEAVLAAGRAALTGAPATVWDLYAGSGLLTVPLARAAAAGGGGCWSVEADPAAHRAAVRNTRGISGAHPVRGDVEALLGTLPRPDLVVLDPPRRGAGAEVSAAIVHAEPATVVYVACDPAALARDAAVLLGGGYRLAALDAVDLFPHTHHVEVVAVFERAATGGAVTQSQPGAAASARSPEPGSLPSGPGEPEPTPRSGRPTNQGSE